MQITEIMHPDYRAMLQDWTKWRITYKGGREFIRRYLKIYSKREDKREFEERKEQTYCPAFAKAAVDDVKNSIYQRMNAICRVGGDEKYDEACEGLEGGVDLQGSSMNNFIGQKILPELLTMQRVGIYVDMPVLSGQTVYETYKERPYLYYYTAEDIRSWSYTLYRNQYTYTNVLLRDYVTTTDPKTGLVTGNSPRYRRLWLEDDGVHVQMHEGVIPQPEIVLKGMTRLPFVVAEISQSLMTDIADYQIALMNLASTDLMYCIRANFPFYTEQYDSREGTFHNRRPVNDPTDPDPPDPVDKGHPEEVIVGTNSGRRYPKGTNKPEFIHPSTEPLIASMQKQEQLKNEIRHLLNLTLSNITPKFASAESKGMDQKSLESGLSAIGLTLEWAEREIAKVWSQYLDPNAKPAEVNYPKTYSLKTEDDKRKDATQWYELMPSVPSLLFKKHLAKKIACELLGDCVTDDEMDLVEAEIDDATYLDADYQAIASDVLNGLVSLETASEARGYMNATEEVAKAKLQHAARLKLIADSQTPKNVQGAGDTNQNATGDTNKNAITGKEMNT